MNERDLAKISNALANGRSSAVYAPGFGHSTKHDQGSREPHRSVGEEKEIHGHHRLENGRDRLADIAGPDWSRYDQRDQGFGVRDFMSKRDRTLILLAILCALVWGALLGQLLS